MRASTRCSRANPNPKPKPNPNPNPNPKPNQVESTLASIDPPPPPLDSGVGGALAGLSEARLPEAAAVEALAPELAALARGLAARLAALRDGLTAQRRQLREGYQARARARVRVRVNPNPNPNLFSTGESSLRKSLPEMTSVPPSLFTSAGLLRPACSRRRLRACDAWLRATFTPISERLPG